MQYLRYAFLLLLAIVLLTVALANLEMVTLRLLPGDLAAFLGSDPQIELPLFLVVLGGLALGLLVGFVWEWLREHRFRAEAARARRELERLEAEKGSKPVAANDGDEVLAILEEGDKPR